MARYNGALPLPLGLIEHPQSEEMEKLETENTTARKGEKYKSPSKENFHNCPSGAAQMYNRSKQGAFCTVEEEIGDDLICI